MTKRGGRKLRIASRAPSAWRRTKIKYGGKFGFERE